MTRLWRAWLKMKEVSRTARARGISASINAIAQQCQTALGLKAATILCSASVDAPLTFGAVRPVIILPERLLEAASPELVTAALGHEMAHIRRRDFMWNLIYELAHLPLSYHRAASLAMRRVRETRELACDEMVAERLMSAKAYARSLVRIASSLTVIERPAYSLGIFDANNLEERIMKLMERRPRARLAKTVFIAALFALAASSRAASAFSLSVGQDKGAGPGGVAIDRPSIRRHELLF
jgi:beta-lactamase regulating signal transducer with metallopeptidase domain